MPCSEKKRLSNLANAARSTGPKSKLGKQKVAPNSLKHGLRSAQVVLPGEDAAAFDAMDATWMDDWQPPTDARRVLVEQAVAHAWRLRRCLKLERDHLVDRGRAAARAHEQSAAARMRAAVALLPKDPAAALATLCREREGVVMLIGLWEELAGAADSPATWRDMAAHHTRLLNLLGYDDSNGDAEVLGGAVLASWCLIEGNEPEPTAYAAYAPADEAEALGLAEELAEFIAEEVERLEAYRDERFATPEQHAARIAQEAALDDSAAGRALLRYEGQHGREFRATLNQLIKLTQTDADLVPDDEPEAEVQAQVVSESKVEPDPSPAPSKATAADAAAPSKATEASEAPSEGPAAPSKAAETAPIEDDPIGRALAAHRARAAMPRLNQ